MLRGCVGFMGSVCCRHNTRKPLREKPPPVQPWILLPVQAAWVLGSPPAWQGDPTTGTTQPCTHGDWMPSDHGGHELLKMPPSGQEGFMGCNARGMWGVPQHCWVKAELRIGHQCDLAWRCHLSMALPWDSVLQQLLRERALRTAGSDA